ncbi:MAG: hypothetical protein AB1757_06455 [Acidobacteriota bacterium]
MFNSSESEQEVEKSLFRQRIKTIIIGSLLAVVLGLVIVNTFTYFQYGGTMFDRFFEKKSEDKTSPDAGRFAYAKGTGDYLGIIRSEGRHPSRGWVYYIEQPGGQLMATAKEKVEVRDK